MSDLIFLEIWECGPEKGQDVTAFQIFFSCRIGSGPKKTTVWGREEMTSNPKGLFHWWWAYPSGDPIISVWLIGGGVSGVSVCSSCILVLGFPLPLKVDLYHFSVLEGIPLR